MKKLNYLLSTVVVLVALVTVGCTKDDDGGETAKEAVLKKFAKTWTFSSATLDGGTITDLDGLILTINANMGYSSSGPSVARQPNPFPSSGLWDFKAEITDKTKSEFTITRDSNLDMNVTVSDTALTLGFAFDDTHTGSQGRDEAVDGVWLVSFTAQ